MDPSVRAGRGRGPRQARRDSLSGSRAIEVVKRDKLSVAGRPLSAGIEWPQLVRRLLKAYRFDDKARASLRDEARWAVRLQGRIPKAEIEELPDGELILRYVGSPGIELDRVLMALEAGGWGLTPSAAILVALPALDVACLLEDESGQPIGHGEIAPRSLILQPDGLGRLFEVRFAAAGVAWHRTADGHACQAPELRGINDPAMPEADVYSFAAMFAASVMGIRRVILESSLSSAVELEAGKSFDPRCAEILVSALSHDPRARPSLDGMREGLVALQGLDDPDELRAIRSGLKELAHVFVEHRSREVFEIPQALCERLNGTAVRPLGHSPSTRASSWIPVAPEPQSFTVPEDGAEAVELPEPDPTDASRGFEVEILDDWVMLTEDLIGVYTGDESSRALKRRELRSLLLTLSAVFVVLLVFVLFFSGP